MTGRRAVTSYEIRHHNRAVILVHTDEIFIIKIEYIKKTYVTKMLSYN